ncbi:lipopolysaccharide kinase InaA family protein [Acidobacteriota bacterium]
MKREYGQFFSLPPFIGRIQPGYNRPPFLEAIFDCRCLLKKQECEILLDSRNRIGAITLPLEEGKTVDVVIKEFQIKGANKLKSTFLPSKAFKAWQGGMVLMEKGIKTPYPIAFLEKRKRVFLDQSFYLTKKVEDIEEIRFLFLRLSPPDLCKLLTALARYLSLCHKKGILHRDLSDGNILVGKERTGKFKFYLIDTNRIRTKKHIRILIGLKNLIRLGIPLRYQRFFLEKYLEIGHVNDFRWAWYRANKITYTWFIKGKKKLRLKKLAQRLKIQ